MGYFRISAIKYDDKLIFFNFLRSKKVKQSSNKPQIMKKIALILVSIICSIGCSKNDTETNEMIQEETPFAFGFDFKLVQHSYENSPLVNSINPSEDVNAQHYVYKSPIHNDQEVGFSMITSMNFVEGNNKVYVFLHGQGGTEHSGFVNYVPYLVNSGLIEDDAVYLLLNGITANGGSWKIKDSEGYYPVHTIRECIDGLLNDSDFTFLSRNRGDWTLVGFSMGGRAALSTALNPDFLQWGNKPAKIFPMGSWLSTENLNEMIDFDQTLANLDAYLPLESMVTVVNHILDRGGDNSISLKVDISDILISNLNSEGFAIENIHITEPRLGCSADDPQIDSCNVHVIHHYLSHINPQNTQQTIGELIHSE